MTHLISDKEEIDVSYDPLVLGGIRVLLHDKDNDVSVITMTSDQAFDFANDLFDHVLRWDNGVGKRGKK